MATKRKKQPTIRGLTVAEYHRLFRRIRAGEFTWNQAETLGLCLPDVRDTKKPLGRPKKQTGGRVASANPQTEVDQ